MHDVVIVSGARTPVGKFGGAFKDVSAPDLGAVAIKAALERAGLPAESVDEVVFGNALQVTESGYAARLASLRAGIPEEVPTIAINRQCSSGLEAINMAAQLVRTGEVEVAIAGGTENMSQQPFVLDYQARFDGLRMGKRRPGGRPDGRPGLPGQPIPHGGYRRERGPALRGQSPGQDELALLSHQRAVSAINSGRFVDQIAEVSVPQRRRDPIVVTGDEGPREDASLERLAQLAPVFKKDGTVTAGNASGISDGAAAVVMMSADKASELGLTPRMRWHTRAVAGVDPAIMGIGPIPAVRKALGKAGMTIEDIDLIELNEAFAAQALYCIRELGLDIDKTNVNGSGISLGHPVGATGAIMTVKLLEELALRKQELGLVTMCVGGGQGVATIFEQVG